MTRRSAAVLVTATLLTACAGADDPATDVGDAASEQTTEHDGSMTDDEMTDDEMSDDDAADTSAPADDAGTDVVASPVLDITATAPDGSTFSIAEFVGDRPVFVETFATWCSTCRRQLGDTTQAALEAGDAATFLILSVETSLDPADLAPYAAENGFEGLTFGVLAEQDLLVLQEQFGGSVLNPPATPKFRVAPDGSLSELTTGLESAEEILASIDA